MLFEKAFFSFKIFVAERQKKQSSETMKNNFKLHILPYFEGRKIEEITKADIIDWQNEILKKNFSNSYNNTLYVEFNTFFKFCCSYYNLDINVVEQVGNFKRKYEEKKFDFYTLKEFKRFIKYVDDNIYKQFFNFMFYVGTRPGETMALKFSDLQGDYVSINKNLTTKGGRVIDTPKNKSSIRKVKIDFILKRDLLKLKKYYIKKYNNPNFDYFIFGGIKPLAPTTINRHKLKAYFKAHLRPITLHQYRHSHATHLAAKKVPYALISHRLGHSKLSTTTDIYIHSDLGQEKRVVRTLISSRFDIFRF